MVEIHHDLGVGDFIDSNRPADAQRLLFTRKDVPDRRLVIGWEFGAQQHFLKVFIARAVGIRGGEGEGGSFSLFQAQEMFFELGDQEPGPHPDGGKWFQGANGSGNHFSSRNHFSYSYSWDAENRLASAAGVTYTYDGDGQRVEKSSGTLYWRGGNGSVVAETDTSGNTLNEYIFFGARIARRDSSGNVYYYFGNHLGSSAITNATGTLCYDADFYPIGGELAFTNNCAQNYKFAGMEQDPETGDYHTQYRQYASNLGRWLSPDPLGGSIFNPQSLNHYAYALNNPITLTDPLGLAGSSYAPAISWNCVIPTNVPNAYTYYTKCEKNNGAVPGTASGSGSCISGEYGCGGSSTSFTYGEDYWDALEENDAIAKASVDANGNLGFTVNPDSGFAQVNCQSGTCVWANIIDPEKGEYYQVGMPGMTQGSPSLTTTISLANSLSPVWNALKTAASDGGFSMGTSGNTNFQPGGSVCVTCAQPPIGTLPEKAASTTPSVPQMMLPFLPSAPLPSSVPVLLPVPSSSP